MGSFPKGGTIPRRGIVTIIFGFADAPTCRPNDCCDQPLEDPKSTCCAKVVPWFSLLKIVVSWAKVGTLSNKQCICSPCVFLGQVCLISSI